MEGDSLLIACGLLDNVRGQNEEYHILSHQDVGVLADTIKGFQVLR